MFSITIKLMKKSARMLIPAGIAILIGTAFIAATFLFSNSMDDSLRRQRTAQLGEANYIATMKTNSNGAVSENGSADRTTVADFNLDRIRATKGVKGARVDTSVSVSISQRASARTDTPSARQPTASCCRSASSPATSRSTTTRWRCQNPSPNNLEWVSATRWTSLRYPTAAL